MTFSTHLGLFWYTRLPYGINAAAEIFQYTLQQQLHGIDGVRNIADDIIIFGNTKQQHDTALEQCLKRLSDIGLTLNREKCSFLQPTLSFFGQIFSAEGTRPDPKRVEDLQNASEPQNAGEVRSLLGMANYSHKYIRDFATITAPLREPTKKNVHFKWEQKHSKAFEKLKDELTKAPVMAYFDTKKETILTVDASPVGISAILSQKVKGQKDPQLVAYASRALTAVEKRYSQTEKESLGIVWGIENFHLYVHGTHVTLVTDHKPLETIFGNPRSKPSARIERWVLRLQPYSFKVEYRAGDENHADYMSRHPTDRSISTHSKISEEYVNCVTKHAVPRAMTLKEIIEATNADKTLNDLRAAIRLNRWDSDIVAPFRKVKDELTVTPENIILRGTRIVLPEVLKQRAVDIAHESHQGLSKVKALLRTKTWFPGIDNLAKRTVDQCIPCQATGKPNNPEPLRMTDMPSGPWQKVHLNFYGPLPSGEHLLVCIDSYSRYILK